MSIDHSLAINVLRDRAEGALARVRDISRQIAPLEQQRDEHLAAARALQAAADSLQADMEADAPEVEYSPADGEQAPRKHKYAVGDRVTTSNSGGYLMGEVGTIETLQPMGTKPHPLSVPWYEVRFPNNSLITMSEGTLSAAPDEQAAPGIKLLPGERLRFDLRDAPGGRAD